MLVTARLRLEPWRAGDWRLVVPLASDPEVMRHISDGAPWPEATTQAFVGRQRALFTARAHCCWKLLDRADGGFVGICGLQPLQGTRDIEVAWWLARNRWGQGLATEAARLAVDDGFVRLGLERIVAVTRARNQRSRAVMARLGMTSARTIDHHGGLVVRCELERPRDHGLVSVDRSA